MGEGCYAAQTGSRVLVSVYAYGCHMRAVLLNRHLERLSLRCIRNRLFRETQHMSRLKKPTILDLKLCSELSEQLQNFFKKLEMYLEF